MSDGTFALSCDKHPPLSVWPLKALTLGACPGCGTTGLYTDTQLARMIEAIRIVGDGDVLIRRLNQGDSE